MSTVERSAYSAVRRAELVRGAIVWRISAAAFGGDGEDVELVWAVDDSRGAGVAEVRRGGRAERVCSAVLRCVSDGDLVHVEASDSAGVVMCATVRVQTGQVLYARTGLLERLGVRGGRYEHLDSVQENAELAE